VFSVTAQGTNLNWILLSRVWVSVTNNNGFWMGLIGTSITITTNYNSSNLWLLKTRSIPYWTTSVFSSAVTHLVLIYESVTYSAYVVLWLTLHSWTMNPVTIELTTAEWVWVLCYDRRSVGQSVLESSTLLGLTSRSLLLSDICGFFIWGVLSDERTGLSFTIAAGPRQRSNFRVRVP
jgi:hypothetical protein